MAGEWGVIQVLSFYATSLAVSSSQHPKRDDYHLYFLARVDSFRFFLEVKQTSLQVGLELTIPGLGDRCLIQ